jgi:hypothetical protein
LSSQVKQALPQLPGAAGTVPSEQAAAAPQSTRLLFIDNLRILLICLVVVQHLAVTYGATGFWYYRDPAQDIFTSTYLTIQNGVGAALANCTVEVIRTAPREPAAWSAPTHRANTPLLSGIGGQAYSISHSGMQLFEQGRINTLMSSTMIDLVSAPIEPGEYRLEVSVTMGGVEIFLPRYVQFTLEGSALAGGRNVHDGSYEGPHIWETTRQKLRYVVNLPEQPPDFAIAPANPERPVRIHFVTHITMGGVDIYRL